MLKVNPLILLQIKHLEAALRLYAHQAVMLDEVEKYKTFLWVTKTGTGKTIGAVMPLLKRKERAILVYPAVALLYRLKLL